MPAATRAIRPFLCGISHDWTKSTQATPKFQHSQEFPPLYKSLHWKSLRRTMRWSGGSRRKEGRADGSFFGRFLVQYQTSPFVSGMDFIAKKIGRKNCYHDPWPAYPVRKRPFAGFAVAVQWVLGSQNRVTVPDTHKSPLDQIHPNKRLVRRQCSQGQSQTEAQTSQSSRTSTWTG